MHFMLTRYRLLQSANIKANKANHRVEQAVKNWPKGLIRATKHMKRSERKQDTQDMRTTLLLQRFGDRIPQELLKNENKLLPTSQGLTFSAELAKNISKNLGKPRQNSLVKTPHQTRENYRKALSGPIYALTEPQEKESSNLDTVTLDSEFTSPQNMMTAIRTREI